MDTLLSYIASTDQDDLAEILLCEFEGCLMAEH